MKNRLLALLMLVGSPLLAHAAPVYYNIDPAHTYPHFAINHLNFTTLYGRFDQTTGRIMIDKEAKNGFIDVKIAAVTVSTGLTKRDDHLRSPDFLNVMEYPDITYESTNIKFNGDNAATVEGKLSMMGVTKMVTLDVHAIRCGLNPLNKKETCGFEARADIKRSDFGSRFGLPGIGDDMKLWFQVEAVRED